MNVITAARRITNCKNGGPEETGNCTVYRNHVLVHEYSHSEVNAFSVFLSNMYFILILLQLL